MQSTVTTLSELRTLREKATPGPWRDSKFGEASHAIETCDGSSDPRIAYVYGAFANKADVREANAALIVALANLDLEKLIAEAKIEGLERAGRERVREPDERIRA